jgi:hypothetical protein
MGEKHTVYDIYFKGKKVFSSQLVGSIRDGQRFYYNVLALILYLMFENDIGH